MKIRCLHGYFILEELDPGDASEFVSHFGLKLAALPNGYTFEALADAPDFAIAGGLYLGAPVTKTFEGTPGEIMRENGLVYSINTGLVVPIASITTPARPQAAGNYFVANGIIQPGSVTEDGGRVKDYAAFYQRDTGWFKYSEISYE